MPKGANQKLKLIYLIKILTELTDEKHKLTMPQIITELGRYGITAERKSIYDDIENMRQLGIEVNMTQEGRNFYYNMVGRQFELAELKLLVDAIQSSKFITKRKSDELIKKLEKYVSKYEATTLNRQIMVSGRIKTMNESIYYNVDELHEAIAENKKIKFKYLEWNLKKELVARKDGADYIVSPWALLWDDENYYLVAYDEEKGIMKHYRVDKMKNIRSLDEKRLGEDVFKNIKISQYQERNFGMYSGEDSRVVLKVSNDKIGVIVDRFGKEIPLMKHEEGYFRTTVSVAMSDQFLGWIFALGDSVQIVDPPSAVDRMKEHIKKIGKMYE
ncbi:MAG: WYL domain-containing protein [Lachnospiraceae bacterium]|nr:WYL domain-containing protein [Lachnospiraceae bacterium]